jgi:hypothetical protein
MFVPFLRRSRFLRALVLTAGVFSFLLWLYIVLRVVFNHVNVMSPFIYRIPSLSFWVLGAWSFAMGFACTFVYLWLWGRFGRSSAFPGSYEYREP